MADFWTTPKENWVSSDGIDYPDLNRIESNTAAIRDATYRKVQGIGFKTDNAFVGQDGLISVFNGSCFSLNGVPIKFTTSFVKNLNSWTLGNGPTYGGMAPAVTVAANTWYYIFVIMNPVDGTTEVMFDDNISGTNISSGTYTEKRRVNSFKTNAAGSYGSFTVMEMYSIGDTTFINPVFASSTGTAISNSLPINNAYQNTTLVVGPAGSFGAALPALDVRAKLNVLIDDVDFGLVSNYLAVFTIPGTFVTGGVPVGEYCYLKSASGAVGALDVDIMVDTSNQIRVALYHPSNTGSVNIRVRGFFDDRRI